MNKKKLLLTTATTIIPALTFVSAKVSNVNNKDFNTNGAGGFNSIFDAIRNNMGSTNNSKPTTNSTQNYSAEYNYILKQYQEQRVKLNALNQHVQEELKTKFQNLSTNIIPVMDKYNSYFEEQNNKYLNEEKIKRPVNQCFVSTHFSLYRAFLNQLNAILTLESNDVIQGVDNLFKEKIAPTITDEALANDDKKQDAYENLPELLNSAVWTTIKPLLGVKREHTEALGEIERLKGQIQSDNEKSTKLNQENEALKAENANLKTENEALKNKEIEQKTDKERLDNLQTQITELNNKYNKLLEENKNDKSNWIVFIATLLSINFILWIIIILLTIKKSNKKKSSN